MDSKSRYVALMTVTSIFLMGVCFCAFLMACFRGDSGLGLSMLLCFLGIGFYLMSLYPIGGNSLEKDFELSLHVNEKSGEARIVGKRHRDAS